MKQLSILLLFACTLTQLLLGVEKNPLFFPFAEYDPACNSMSCKEANVDPIGNPLHENYFQKEVPNNIHQIWFGDKRKLKNQKTDLWQEYAQMFGYTYKLWTEDDDHLMQQFMKPENFTLMQQLRSQEEYASASDVLRYELIKKFGGVYTDCDFSPPTHNQKFVDLKKVIPFRGLTLMTEHDSRNIGNATALFVANGFIVAPPEHPILCSVVQQIYTNAMHWYTQNNLTHAQYTTGPFLLNKVLTGNVNIVPCKYLHSLRMH